MSEHMDVIKQLLERRAGMRDWISSEASYTAVDQRHLVESSSERGYWHHGYMAALDDVIGFICANSREDCNAGKPN